MQVNSNGRWGFILRDREEKSDFEISLKYRNVLSVEVPPVACGHLYPPHRCLETKEAYDVASAI